MQKNDKISVKQQKRAQALRENLKKRKALSKAQAQQKPQKGSEC